MCKLMYHECADISTTASEIEDANVGCCMFKQHFSPYQRRYVG